LEQIFEHSRTTRFIGEIRGLPEDEDPQDAVVAQAFSAVLRNGHTTSTSDDNSSFEDSSTPDDTSNISGYFFPPLVCGMEISVHAPCNPSPDKRYPGLCDQSYRSFLQHDLRRGDAEGLVEFSEKRKLNIRTNSTGVVIFIQRAQFLSFPNTEQHKDGLTSTSPARNGG
jgi:hypothetical protein